jgi:hypothetical protein
LCWYLPHIWVVTISFAYSFFCVCGVRNTINFRKKVTVIESILKPTHKASKQKFNKHL